MNKTELLAQLNIAHTSQCSRDSRNYKDAVSTCLFAVFQEMLEKGFEEEKLKPAIMDDPKRPLYIWTKSKIETISHQVKGNEGYLCTSLSQTAFNKDVGIFSGPYRYKYEIYLKENTYGILLYRLEGCIHPEEQECLIKLSDIKEYKKIN